MFVYLCLSKHIHTHRLIDSKQNKRWDNCVTYLILDQYVFWNDKMELIGCDGTNLSQATWALNVGGLGV